MFFRGLSLILMLVLATACSTTGKSSSANGGAGGNSSAEARYGSADLEPFSVIEGSDIGARAHDRVFFDYDSSVISATGQATLDKQADWLKKNADVAITVEGHCDERGTREYNLALGDRRATAAKNYLVGSGVSASRITVISYGKERPAIVGSDESAWSENRRAVTILK